MIIRTENLTKVYRMGKENLRVLDGISLSVEEGEFVAIMGSSGSGKSTLMHILGLLDKPTAGKYFLFGRDVSLLGDAELAQLRSRTIGFVFQQFNLLPKMTAEENVSLPQIYLGEKKNRKSPEEFLKSVGLADRMKHKPGELSGGQQQRVSIARALVNRPKIIFADEPTGNLSSEQSAEIMKIFTGLNEKGITVILVTHEEDIAGYAKRIIKIRDGTVISDTKNETQEKVRSSKMRLSKKPLINGYEIRENFISAAKSIIANKTRSFLTMLGIIIGVSALISMLAVGYGAQKSLEGMMSSLGSNLLMIFPQTRKVAGVAVGIASRLDRYDIEAMQKIIPYIKKMDANVSGKVQAVYKAANTRTSVTGATENYALMRNAIPAYGRFFSREEVRNMAKVAVIGPETAENLFGEKNPIGKKIKINRKNFTVIGVLPVRGASGPSNKDDMILVPLTTAMKSLFGYRYYHMIIAEVSKRDKIPEVQEKIKNLMRIRDNIKPWQEDSVNVVNLAEIQEMVSGITKTLNMLLGIIASISLLVGGIGIMNIMLVSVSERTREIGLRKAIGATRFTILFQFLVESSVISLTGGILGIIIGAAASLVLGKATGWAIQISPFSVSLAFFFSVGIGIIFGFWPAKKASLLSPIDALRYE